MRARIVKSIEPLARLAEPGAPAPTSDYDLNQAFRPETPAPLRPAAVLVALVEHPEGLTVLLTQRTDHLTDHAGQISFPGGRAEPGDAGPVDTALRETREELGLDPARVEAVGYLDTYETVTGFSVTPVVGFVQPGFELAPDEFEVADVFEVPLAFLLDPANQQTHRRFVRGAERRYHVFEYGERYIWGATAGMLMNLVRRLGGDRLI